MNVRRRSRLCLLARLLLLIKNITRLINKILPECDENLFEFLGKVCEVADQCYSIVQFVNVCVLTSHHLNDPVAHFHRKNDKFASSTRSVRIQIVHLEFGCGARLAVSIGRPTKR